MNKNFCILPSERLETLEFDDLYIIQDKSGYCFTSDSVLISNLCNVKKTDKVVDLGAGSGVIAILIAGKHKGCKVVGVEIQSRLADMAKRSVTGNSLDDCVTIVNADMRKATELIGDGYDVVVSNPPYERLSPKESYSEIEICKSEVCVNIDEVIITASKLLKFGGLFYMINKARRLTDCLTGMRNNGIEPKKIYLIQPKKDKDIDTFIVEGKRGGKPGLVVPKPIIVYEDNGEYTDFCRRLYNK